jgi:hypothetical protein
VHISIPRLLAALWVYIQMYRGRPCRGSNLPAFQLAALTTRPNPRTRKGLGLQRLAEAVTVRRQCGVCPEGSRISQIPLSLICFSLPLISFQFRYRLHTNVIHVAILLLWFTSVSTRSHFELTYTPGPDPLPPFSSRLTASLWVAGRSGANPRSSCPAGIRILSTIQLHQSQYSLIHSTHFPLMYICRLRPGCLPVSSLFKSERSPGPRGWRVCCNPEDCYHRKDSKRCERSPE